MKLEKKNCLSGTSEGKKKYIFFITVAIIRFDLGLFSDRSIKKKNNPAIKGMEYDRDTELLDVFVEEEVEALIENKQKKRVIHTHTHREKEKRERERELFLKAAGRGQHKG